MQQYWIDRKGNIHKFKGDMSKEYVSLHYQIAQKLFPTKENPEKHLEVEGWIKVGSLVYNHPIIYKLPSQPQIDILFDLDLLNRLFIEENGYFKKYIYKVI